MAVTAARQNEIGLELLRIPMRSYRAVPIFYPALSGAFALFLQSQYDWRLILAWWFAVVAVQIEYAFFQRRFFALEEARETIDATAWTRACATRYWIMNAFWVSTIPLFWNPDSQIQNLSLVLVHAIHVISVSTTVAAQRPLYFAAACPSAAMAVVACFVEGTPLFQALGATLILAAFYFGRVARQARLNTEDAVMLRLDNADLIRDLAAASDASDAARRRAEEANAQISQREERFRALVENAFDAIVVTDIDNIITYASPSVRSIGFSPEAMIGRSSISFMSADEAARIQARLEAEGGRTPPGEHLEFHTRGPDGRMHWFESSVTDLRANPSVGGYVINLRDITERKRSERELVGQFRVLEALATGTPLDEVMTLLASGAEETNPGAKVGVYLTDEDGKLTVRAAPSFTPEFRVAVEKFWDENRARGYGGAIEEKTQRVIICDIREESADPALHAFSRIHGTRAIWFQRIVSRSGHGLGGLTFYFDEPRKFGRLDSDYLTGLAHLAGIAVDRRRAEENLREAMETAELANRAKSKFLANMSHELRTPLNAIIGFSEIMRDGLFGSLGSARYTEYAKDIHDSGAHLLSVIDDILDISKIEAGRYPLEEQDMDLVEVLRWSIDIVRPRTNEKQQSMKLAVSDGMPPLRADLRAMRQIMLNLLSNASKFTPEFGRIDVSARILDNGNLELSVADTGIGIPEEKLDEVMEPFGQVDDSSARQHGGTGLGLPITKSLTEMHGGTFRLESTLGHGTKATLTLPATRLLKTVARPTAASR